MILQRSRPNGDEGLLLRQPIDAVEEEIAVARLIEEGVAYEIGATDGHNPRLPSVPRLE